MVEMLVPQKSTINLNWKKKISFCGGHSITKSKRVKLLNCLYCLLHLLPSGGPLLQLLQAPTFVLVAVPFYLLLFWPSRSPQRGLTKGSHCSCPCQRDCLQVLPPPPRTASGWHGKQSGKLAQTALCSQGLNKKSGAKCQTKQAAVSIASDLSGIKEFCIWMGILDFLTLGLLNHIVIVFPSGFGSVFGHPAKQQPEEPTASQ